MPAHSLDLVLAPEHDRAVRARWDALHAAGLPSLTTHRSSSNAPHLTVLSAPGFENAVLQDARELLRPLLPILLPVAGLTVLGSGPFVLTEALAVPPGLHTAAAELRRMCGGENRPWIPHVTLAARLDATAVGRALEVLSDVPAPRALEAVALRRWDPDRRETTVEVP